MGFIPVCSVVLGIIINVGVRLYLLPIVSIIALSKVLSQQEGNYDFYLVYLNYLSAASCLLSIHSTLTYFMKVKVLVLHSKCNKNSNIKLSRDIIEHFYCSLLGEIFRNKYVNDDRMKDKSILLIENTISRTSSDKLIEHYGRVQGIEIKWDQRYNRIKNLAKVLEVCFILSLIIMIAVCASLIAFFSGLEVLEGSCSGSMDCFQQVNNTNWVSISCNNVNYARGDIKCFIDLLKKLY